MPCPWLSVAPPSLCRRPGTVAARLRGSSSPTRVGNVRTRRGAPGAGLPWHQGHPSRGATHVLAALTAYSAGMRLASLRSDLPTRRELVVELTPRGRTGSPLIGSVMRLGRSWGRWSGRARTRSCAGRRLHRSTSTAARLADSLHVAAEQLAGAQTVAALDQADQYIPGLTREPAWPTLRAHLFALAAETGEHPLRHLLTAATGGDLGTADNMAAVLYWRLTALAPTDPGPLSWLPGIPETLHAHPVWGPTLPSDPNLLPTSPTRSNTTPAKLTARQPGLQPELTGDRSHRRNRSMAGRQRHQSPRPATNRRRPTRNAPGPLETAPRPTYRPFHRLVRQRAV